MVGGQEAVVGLASSGEGHCWQLVEDGWHHVGGEGLAQSLGEFVGGERTLGGEMGTEVLAVGGEEDDGLADVGHLGQLLLYFFGGDAVAVQFEQSVFAAYVLQLALVVPAGQVASVVGAGGHVGGFLGAGEAEFAHFATGDEVAVRVEDGG